MLGNDLLRWTPAGYTDRVVAKGQVETITPRTLIEVLRTAWEPAVPLLHPSANRGADHPLLSPRTRYP